MTAPGIRVLAGRLLVAHDLSEDQAESILRAFTAAGLNIIRPPAPVEPKTGDRAPSDVAEAKLAEMRATLHRKRTAPIIATEHEENEA